MTGTRKSTESPFIILRMYRRLIGSLQIFDYLKLRSNTSKIMAALLAEKFT